MNNRLRQLILDAVGGSNERLTRPLLEKAVLAQCRAEKRQIRSAVTQLVDEGELAYTYEHGCSFIEPSFNRPVRISSHVVITPPGIGRRTEPGDVTVVIDPGDAFGTGRHPTTRLSIRGIEAAMDLRNDSDIAPCDRSLLDVGTGSGVLLITALLMGGGKGLGVDREPCAVAEAGKNIQHNRLSDRVVVTDQDFNTIRGTYSMITANLRYPSLIRFAGRISGLLEPQGLAVLSGMKIEEAEAVADAYAGFGMTVVWKAHEKGWVGMVLRK